MFEVGQKVRVNSSATSIPCGALVTIVELAGDDAVVRVNAKAKRVSIKQALLAKEASAQISYSKEARGGSPKRVTVEVPGHLYEKTMDRLVERGVYSIDVRWEAASPLAGVK